MINQTYNISMLDLSLRSGTSRPQGGDGSFAQVLSTAKSAVQVTDLDDIFERAARQHQVPVSLLKAMAKAESNFRADAVSPAGAMGVMQLMPATARSLGVTDPLDPEQNIMGGAKYISGMLERYDGDITLALAAYNAGSGNVSKYGGVPPFKETQNYIQKIMGYMGADLTVPQVQAAATGPAENVGAALTELFSSDVSQEEYQAMVSRWKSELDMKIFSQLISLQDEEKEARI